MYHDMYEHDRHSAGAIVLTLVDPRQLSPEKPGVEPNEDADYAQTAAMRTGLSGNMIGGLPE